MTDYQAHPEYLALLTSVLERPEDDAPRGVIADWIEEAGDDERAELIRRSIADQSKGAYFASGDTVRDHRPHTDVLTILPKGAAVCVNRGFVAEVRLTCAAFVGGVCRSCGIPEWRLRHPGVDCGLSCPLCVGTGRIPGVAEALFRAHPIERVVLTDKEPYSRDDDLRAKASLYNASCPPDVEFLTHPASEIPTEIFAHLPTVGQTGNRLRLFKNNAAASAALSIATTNYGRQLVGLPPLEPRT